MSRAALVVACAILIAAPFGEGGRAPLALALLQTLVLLFVLLVVLAPRAAAAAGAAWSGGARALAIVAGFALLLALLAARGAGYPLAAALGLVDLLAAAGLLVASLAAIATDADLHVLRVAAAGSTALQAVLAVAFAIGRGRPAAGTLLLNPNHLAALLNVGVLLCLAGMEAAPSRRGRAVWIAAAAAHLAALGLLASRGALAGLGAAGVVWIAARWRDWRPAIRRGALGALAGALALGGLLVLLRLAQAEDPYLYARVSIWRASLRMVADHPFLGHGPGMFPHVSGRYNFRVDRGPIFFGRTFQGAHNVFLTLAAEEGVPFTLCVLAVACLACRLLLKRARAGGCDAAIMGSGAGIVALLAQGCVEDLQQRPALFLTAALLAGCSVGAARGGPRGVDPPGFPTPAPGPAPGPAPRAPAPRAAILTLACVIFGAGILAPWAADCEARRALAAGPAGLASMERAARLNPWHPEYRHDLAMAALNSGPPDPERYARAAIELMEAARLKPIDYRFPLLLARLEDRVAPALFTDRGAPDRATALYARAARLAPLDPRPSLELAGHLVARGRLEEGLEATARSVAVEPNFLRARILQASILARLGREEEARRAREALDATLRALAGYEPDSSYARDLVQDAPEERRRLMAAAAPSPDPPENRATR